MNIPLESYIKSDQDCDVAITPDGIILEYSEKAWNFFSNNLNIKLEIQTRLHQYFNTALQNDIKQFINSKFITNITIVLPTSQHQIKISKVTETKANLIVLNFEITPGNREKNTELINNSNYNVSEFEYKTLISQLHNGVAFFHIDIKPDLNIHYTLMDYNKKFLEILLPATSSENVKESIFKKNYTTLYRKFDKLIEEKKHSYIFEFNDNYLLKYLKIHLHRITETILSVTLRDLSEINTYKQKLIDSDEKFSHFVKFSTDGIIIISETGKVIVWNKALEEITEINAAQTIDKNIWEIYPFLTTNKIPDTADFDHYQNFFFEMLYINSTKYINKVSEFKIQTPGGKEIYLQYVIFPIKTKSEVFFGAVFRDTTAINQVIGALSKSEFYLKKIQNITKLGNWEINFTTNSFYWSEQIYKQFDYEQTGIDLSIKILVNHVHPDDKTRILHLLLKMLKEKETQISARTRIVTNKNIEKYVYIEIENNFDENGLIIYSFGLIQDETAFQKNLLKLTESEKQLKHSLETKNKFFSIIAHDLKNPFNHILGFSEILCENGYEYPIDKIMSIAGLIKTSAENTYNLLENLLHWSRTQSGKLEIRPEIIDINEIFLEKVRIYASLAARKNITITSKISTPEPPLIYADLNMINTIFRNVVSNAIKFTNEQGLIILDVQNDANPDYFKFRIIDSGIGMPMKTAVDLFNSEILNSTQGTHGEKGTGLGLLLCKEFVEAHGGTIGAKSAVGIGTTIWFTLPKPKK